MTSLSDTQRVLLSHASQRDTGSILPLPPTMKPGGGAAKAVAALIKRALAEERGTSEAATVHRVEGELSYGVFITPAGGEAIGIEVTTALPVTATQDLPAIAASATKRGSKIAIVLALLGRPEGATAPELIAATGWLPHTMRAALTGLRRKGHDIARIKRDGVTGYRIAAQA